MQTHCLEWSKFFSILYWISLQSQKCMQGSKGWRSGENARLPPMWPGLKPRSRRHMWLGFVVGSLLCSERVFSRYSSFLLSLGVLPPNHYLFILFMYKVWFHTWLQGLGNKTKEITMRLSHELITHFFCFILTGMTKPSMNFNIISKLVYFRAFWCSTIEVLEII